MKYYLHLSISFSTEAQLSIDQGHQCSSRHPQSVLQSSEYWFSPVFFAYQDSTHRLKPTQFSWGCHLQALLSKHAMTSSRNKF